jgi:hypothetical protein
MLTCALLNGNCSGLSALGEIRLRSCFIESASFTPSATNALTVTPRVGGSVALRVVAVPVQIANTLGQVVADSEAYLRARLPAAQITRLDHAPLVSAQVTTLPTTSDEWSTAFSRILGEVDDLHLLENASRTLLRLHPQADFGPGWRRLSAR